MCLWKYLYFLQIKVSVSANTHAQNKSVMESEIQFFETAKMDDKWIAKWISSEHDIIIFDEPTRGIDVGAKQEIYMLMDELTKQGKAVIMISSDMEELLGMSDRIIVLSEGKQTGELKRGEFTQEAVMTYASKNA